MPRKSNSVIETELISEIQDYFDLADGADSENRQRFTDDLQFCFVPGAQWDANALLNRQGRPCYSYNRTVGSVNQVVGDQRQAKAGGKVRPTNKQASLEVAEIYGGLIRNIEACSSAQRIYDRQFKYAVAGGWGAARINPKYADDFSFEQELEICDIPNPLTVLFDPSSQDPCKRDQMRCVVAERISRKQFEAEYPGYIPQSIEVTRDSRGWATKDEVRVAEYYKRVCKKKKIALLSDGRVVDYTADLKRIVDAGELDALAEAGLSNVTIEDVRTTDSWSVKWWKVDGCQVLEGPIEYRWKRIPVFKLPGRYVNIEGKQILASLIRHTKDAQRSYNYNRSTMVELTALTPRAPYIGTAKMFKGYETQWNNANKVNRPYLTYDPDPDAPGARPTREPPPNVPEALIALAAQDAEDIKQTTGYTNPASIEGAGGTDESGRALIQRSRVGDSGSYEFVDNLEMFIQCIWEACIDMIPTVYDTARVVRIIGEDETEDYAEVNQPGEQGGQLMNDLAAGKYDVTVTIGPAYATARMEALSTLMDGVERMPIIGEIAPDIIAKNFDVEGADELYKRLRMRLIQQGIVQPDEKEAAEMPPPTPPDPTQTALVERLQAQTAKDAATAQKTQAEMQRLPLDLEQQVADIVNKRLDSLLKASQVAQSGASLVQSETRRATDGAPAT